MSFEFSNIQFSYGSHCVQYDSDLRTIVMLCGGANLFDVSDNLGPTGALTQESEGVWVLNANLVIGNSATLNINSTNAKWLKINSTNVENPYHIHVLGNLKVDSVRISSWNFTSQKYSSLKGSIPRAYITALPGSTGNVTISNGEVSFLGYNFPLREGLSFYGGSASLVNDTIHDQYFGIFSSNTNLTSQNNRLYGNTYNVSVANKLEYGKTASNNSSDKIPPYVAIRYPHDSSKIPSTGIEVEGVAMDEQSGVQKVEIFEHTFPFNNEFPYKLAIPSSNGSWSDWSYHFNVTTPGSHRISARVTDASGNENWAETIIDIIGTNVTKISGVSNESLGKRLAIVRPVFTDGAYNVDGFYEFYPKYDKVQPGIKVSSDLHLLSSNIPAYEEGGGSLNFTINLLDHLKNLTHDIVVNISDEDVDQGYIFNDDGSNAYDILFMLHDEYATNNSYYNLKQFVTNGGSLVFLDGNVFYAQVLYNPDLHTVTLLRGHDWWFNGKSAEKNVHERWLEENRDWVGSNFLYSSIDAPINFTDNPFNYTHFEENYLANPSARILYDYGALIPSQTSSDNNPNIPHKIVTYSLQYGKGRVIMLGIYGQHLLHNSAFLKFFDNIIFPQAVGSYYMPSSTTIPINYYLKSGHLSSAEVQAGRYLALNLVRTKNIADTLFLTIPKKLISYSETQNLNNLSVTLEGKIVQYDAFIGANDVGITIPISPDSKGVRIRL